MFAVHLFLKNIRIDVSVTDYQRRLVCSLERFEVHGHRKGSIARSGLHMVNKLLTVLLLRAPMCRASVGRRFREDRAVRSTYSKMRIIPYYVMLKSPCA